MKREDLLRLKAIADMKKESDLQHVSRIAAQMAALQADIDRIRQHADARSACRDLDAARLSGADVTWQRAAEQQIRSMQQRRAGLAAARAAYVAVARKSFGRAQVMDALASRKSRPPR